MDLKTYYQKIREEESKIADEFPIVVSHETADGGKAGNRTEVPRRLAAKLIVEGLARLANCDEAQIFREAAAAAKLAFDQLSAAAKVQVSVLSTTELEKLQRAAKSKE